MIRVLEKTIPDVVGIILENGKIRPDEAIPGAEVIPEDVMTLENVMIIANEVTLEQKHANGIPADQFRARNRVHQPKLMLMAKEETEKFRVFSQNC